MEVGESISRRVSQETYDPSDQKAAGGFSVCGKLEE
jgi:hypothetical protein